MMMTPTKMETKNQASTTDELLAHDTNDYQANEVDQAQETTRPLGLTGQPAEPKFTKFLALLEVFNDYYSKIREDLSRASFKQIFNSYMIKHKIVDFDAQSKFNQGKIFKRITIEHQKSLLALTKIDKLTSEVKEFSYQLLASDQRDIFQLTKNLVGVLEPDAQADEQQNLYIKTTWLPKSQLKNFGLLLTEPEPSTFSILVALGQDALVMHAEYSTLGLLDRHGNQLDLNDVEYFTVVQELKYVQLNN